MTYTCTVAWCTFDGRTLAALRRHIRQVHPWMVARERAAAASAREDRCTCLGGSYGTDHRRGIVGCYAR